VVIGQTVGDSAPSRSHHIGVAAARSSVFAPTRDAGYP
jgi:hypothetical protein